MRVANLTVLLAFLGLFGGCSGCDEPAPLETEPPGEPKSFFVGDPDDPSDDPIFFARIALIDEGYGRSDLFAPAAALPVVRVRWEITEELLAAREVAADPGSVTDGRVFAAFQIGRAHV